MILYLDSSALVKLYVTEPGSQEVRRAVKSASAVYTHLLAYAEIRAALAKAFRLKRTTARGLARHKQEFERDWKRMGVLLPVEAMIHRAGDLAERHGLRGYDSVHLAAAEALHLNSLPTGSRLACFDAAMNAAGRKLSLPLLDE